LIPACAYEKNICWEKSTLSINLNYFEKISLRSCEKILLSSVVIFEGKTSILFFIEKVVFGNVKREEDYVFYTSTFHREFKGTILFMENLSTSGFQINGGQL
jgi:hypothetical protein